MLKNIVHMIAKVVAELLTFYDPETPVAVVQKASWDDQKIVRGTLEDIADRVKDAGITKTALIVVGDVLGIDEVTPSKLYDAHFTHEYRKGEGE